MKAYIPPFKEVQNVAGISEIGDEEYIAINLSFFKYLVRLCLESYRSDFDETTYLRKNPDVAEAVEDQKLPSGFEHYAKWGYFENRVPAFAIDPEEYRIRYPDVAQLPSQQIVEHFSEIGYFEGRVLNDHMFHDRLDWIYHLKTVVKADDDPRD